MISITGVTNNYSLQPALLEKHSTTLKWLSDTMHWKSELAFFQKLLEEQRNAGLSRELRQDLDYFDNQFIYFTEEAIEELRKKLRNHESRLAKMLEAKSEWDTEYYKEHDSLMEDAAKLSELIRKLTDKYRQWIKTLQSQNKKV